uniref:collagen-like protein n=1 Tax=Lactiplantibacillus plantarum TaxID=1590 RepID=UPI0021CB9527|nr:collagen-like protein [Lactiplantibacillus plantarum]
MAKTLSFTDTSPQTVKIGDTTTSFTLICGNDNVATDLTNATSITVKLGNASGYLKSVQIDPTKLVEPWTGKITVNFTADLMTSLPAGSYAIEVWVVDSTGTSIYPSDGSTGFTIANNIQSTTGGTITTITFDDFVEAMNKAASTIAKGDPGEGLDIKGQVTSVSALPTTANEGDGYLVNEELYVYTIGAWKDCGTIQGPQGIQGKTGTGISSTTIQYQISNSATTSPTGTWSNSIVATTITNPYLWMKATLNYTDGTTKDFYLVSQKGDKGDKGDTPDLSNYVTVTDLNNGLSTKVTDNKNGEISVNGTSILPANEDVIGRIDGSYTDMNDIPMGWLYLNGWANVSSLANWGLPQGLYYVHCFKSNYGVHVNIQIAYGTHNNMYVRTMSNTTWTTWKLLADDSKVVHSTDMRKPASDVAGIEEVNAKQDKIGYTPADDSKVLHLSTGDTASRPDGISAGYQYFDTSLNKPIWYTGKNWVDATGTTV